MLRLSISLFPLFIYTLINHMQTISYNTKNYQNEYIQSDSFIFNDPIVYLVFSYHLLNHHVHFDPKFLSQHDKQT